MLAGDDCLPPSTSRFFLDIYLGGLYLVGGLVAREAFKRLINLLLQWIWSKKLKAHTSILDIVIVLLQKV